MTKYDTVSMAITIDEYDRICGYIKACAVGEHMNPSRLAACQWIVDRVSEGAIRVVPE